MKTIKKSIEWAAKILSFLILLQSCTVYHNYSSSVDEAIATNDKVKLDINNDDPYKFKKIKIFETEYYGLTKIKSDTYRRLSDRKKMDAGIKNFASEWDIIFIEMSIINFMSDKNQERY